MAVLKQEIDKLEYRLIAVQAEMEVYLNQLIE